MAIEVAVIARFGAGHLVQDTLTSSQALNEWLGVSKGLFLLSNKHDPIHLQYDLLLFFFDDNATFYLSLVFPVLSK